MLNMQTNSLIDISKFCDIQGVKDVDRIVLTKSFSKDGNKDYDSWYKILSQHFPYYPKKTNFSDKQKEPVEIVESKEIISEKNSKKTK